MPDLIESQQREITRRLDELRPVVAEYERLEAAAEALGSVSSATRSAVRKASAKPAGKRRASRPSRPRGGRSRAAEAHAIISQQPGIGIPELASKMGIHNNYLYRVLPGLQKEGKITKKDKGWHAKG